MSNYEYRTTSKSKVAAEELLRKSLAADHIKLISIDGTKTERPGAYQVLATVKDGPKKKRRVPK